ncbi:hypothetical protein EMIHUDRAFT_57025, partial [Emiliania huxleyi CCMP1516]|uniref:Uncharacterized protein n=2 Tax=Emiliania huxleyi TaxID=2903 RepID=A0A0D3KRQ5_EMIH1
WTHDEDVLLVRAVEQCGESNWQRVSELLGNTRSSNQCLQRWRYSVDPSLNKGKWSEARRWTDIGREVDGRTPMQCRERWCNRLDPALK